MQREAPIHNKVEVFPQLVVGVKKTTADDPTILHEEAVDPSSPSSSSSILDDR